MAQTTNDWPRRQSKLIIIMYCWFHYDDLLQTILNFSLTFISNCNSFDSWLVLKSNLSYYEPPAANTLGTDVT